MYIYHPFQGRLLPCLPEQTVDELAPPYLRISVCVYIYIYMHMIYIIAFP